MSNFALPNAYYICNDCQCSWTADEFPAMHLHISRSGHVAHDTETGSTYEVDTTIAMEVALFEDTVTYGMRKPCDATTLEKAME